MGKKIRISVWELNSGAPLGLKAEAPSPKQNHIPQLPIPGLKAGDFAEGIANVELL